MTSWDENVLALICILWHWKPAACGRQDGFIEVSENPRRKHHAAMRKLMLGYHWNFQQDNDPK